MENLHYNKIAYQTFDLKLSGAIFSIENFINKNYNFIEGFLFSFDNPVSLIPDAPFIINEFRIDDIEILPKGFFIDNLMPGKKTPFLEKFTPINFPVKQGKLKLSVNQMIATVSTFSITFKLKKEFNETLFYKDFFKYDCHTFRVDLLANTSDDGVFKKSIRPNIPINTIKGIAFDLYPAVIKSNPLKNHQLGTLKMSINTKKSNPINVPIYNHTAQRIGYKKSFIELDENIEPGASIDLVYEKHLGSIASYVNSFVNTTAYFTLTIKSI